MADTDLVVVGTFPNRVEAALAQSALAAYDIKSTVLADDTGGMREIWDGVRLFVRAGDAEKAVAILRQPE
jgi:hypothetical protein